jgi:hypothetical protein
MIPDRSIAANERHIAALTFTGVGKNSVRSPAIGVAKSLAGLTGEKEDVGATARGCDAAALLSAVDLMDIPLAMIEASNLVRNADGLCTGGF